MKACGQESERDHPTDRIRVENTLIRVKAGNLEKCREIDDSKPACSDQRNNHRENGMPDTTNYAAH